MNIETPDLRAPVNPLGGTGAVSTSATVKARPPSQAPQILSSPELINIGLGQLIEARKQTLLLESLGASQSEVMNDTNIAIPDMDSGGMAMGGISIPELAGGSVAGAVQSEVGTPTIESPIIELPEVVVTAPRSEMEDSVVPRPEELMPLIELPEVVVTVPTVVMDMPTVVVEDAPQLVMQDVTMPEAPPPLELQEYEMPSAVTARDSVKETTTQTEPERPEANVTVTNNITINQAPGQDPEELGRIVMRQINESTETFLIQ